MCVLVLLVVSLLALLAPSSAQASVDVLPAIYGVEGSVVIEGEDDVVLRTQQNGNVTATQIMGSMEELVETRIELAATRAELSETKGDLSAAVARIATLEENFAKVLAILSPQASVDNLVDVNALKSTVISNSQSISKVVLSLSANPATPSEDALVSSSQTLSLVNTKANNSDLLKVIAALSATDRVDDLLDVPSMNAQIGRHSVTLDKLVDSTSRVSPGDEDNLIDVAAIVTRLSQNEALDTTQANSISGLTTRIAATEALDITQGVSISGLGTRMTTAESGLGSVTTRLTDNEAATAGVSTRLSTAESKISSHAERLASNEAAIAQANSRIVTQGDSITQANARIAAIESKNVDQDTQATALAGRVSTTERDISGLVTRANNMDQTNTAQNTAITDLTSRMRAAEQSLTTNNAKDISQDEQLTSLGGRAVSAENRLTGVEGRMTTAERDITSVRGSATTLTGDVSSLKTKVATLEGSSSSQATSISGLLTRMTTAESANTAQDTSISHLKPKDGYDLVGFYSIPVVSSIYGPGGTVFQLSQYALITFDHSREAAALFGSQSLVVRYCLAFAYSNTVSVTSFSVTMYLNSPSYGNFFAYTFPAPGASNRDLIRCTPWYAYNLNNMHTYCSSTTYQCTFRATHTRTGISLYIYPRSLTAQLARTSFP